MSANNLSVAPPKMGIKPAFTGSKKYNPVGGDVASGVGEVEHLNKMLNNINVQTKKNDLTDGKLPRKII